jgi:hypothetical protein
MTFANAIRNMTDDEICRFLVTSQIKTMIHTAETLGFDIKEEIELEKQSMYDRILEEIKSEI